MKTIVFVHGMFQNPKSWENWVRFFSERGYDCKAPAWPLHEGDPKALRHNPPVGLGELSLDEIYNSIAATVATLDQPIVTGHSVGGLIAQKLLARGVVSGAVAISYVAPNAMLDFDWGFIKNSAIITNPFKGDEPVYMDAKTFHGAFANTLSEDQATAAFEQTATHDSRNVLRDCMGKSGRIDLARPYAPLLLIAAEEEVIIPADLCEKRSPIFVPGLPPSASGRTGWRRRHLEATFTPGSGSQQPLQRRTFSAGSCNGCASAPRPRLPCR